MSSNDMENPSRDDSWTYQPPASNESTALSKKFGILTQRASRHILVHLLQQENPITIDDLTAHVERDIDILGIEAATGTKNRKVGEPTHG
ncbi:hypothetical protein [Halomicrococcus sp. NG-SE-24]|uniref:hypothetical protein n=1 Tax=Halomicrococcus sp. NG-SE-24 TaxID=3436928 RepID=UPI003D97F267